MYNIEELEKMVKEACEKNDYKLYRKACCFLHLYIKLYSENEEGIACFVLYDALSNEKSQDFLNIATEIINGDKKPSYSDAMLCALLLSVRASSDLVTAFLLNICDDMQNEVLKMVVEGEK